MQSGTEMHFPTDSAARERSICVQRYLEMEKAEKKEDIYEYLKRCILSFELKPGDMLSENALAAQMNVTRPVVREALTRLSEDGGIVVYPQRGSEVTKLDPDRIRQSVSSHIILETSVIDEVCRMPCEDGLEKLAEQAAELRSLAQCSDIYAFLRKELGFHYSLAKLCGREYAWEIFRCMDCDLIRLKYLLYNTYNYKVDMSSLTSRENAVTEVRLMLDNIRRGDTEAAALICTNHFNNLSWNTGTLQKIYPQFFAARM